MKIILWIPYIAAQILLVWIIVWIKINTDISTNDGFFIGSLVAFHGGLMAWSSDLLAKHRFKSLKYSLKDIVSGESLVPGKEYQIKYIAENDHFEVMAEK